MTRKFSEISLSNDIGLINLIETKISKFRTRFERDTDPMAEAFYNAMQFILIPQVKNIDLATIQIFDLLKNNPDVIMDSSMEGLWHFCGERYNSLYTSVRGFNESGPGVNDILNSSDWQNFQKNIKSQLHEFDTYQSRFSERFEKVNELETRTYTLLSLVRSAIIESNGIPKEIKIPKEIEESKVIAKYLLDNKDMLDSAIQSAESIQTFNVNNIDEALRNVGEMFYNKDIYIIFQNEWNWSKLYKFMKKNILESIFFTLNDFYSSPKWWLFFGLIPLVLILWLLGTEYLGILSGIENDLKKYKEYWQILISTHLILVSFIGYLVVFCFGNYKKLEHRAEAYKFRSILTKSFGYLIKSADEEQKKILYPKALDAIFRDLPDSGNAQPDVNISLPVTEIMKGLTGK